MLAVAAAATVLVLTGTSVTAVLTARQPATQTSSAVALSVTETAVPWGTRLQIEASGLPAGGPFRVWVEDATGTRTPVGSFGPSDDGGPPCPPPAN